MSDMQKKIIRKSKDVQKSKSLFLRFVQRVKVPIFDFLDYMKETRPKKCYLKKEKNSDCEEKKNLFQAFDFCFFFKKNLKD